MIFEEPQAALHPRCLKLSTLPAILGLGFVFVGARVLTLLRTLRPVLARGLPKRQTCRAGLLKRLGMGVPARAKTAAAGNNVAVGAWGFEERCWFGQRAHKEMARESFGGGAFGMLGY